MFIYNKKASSYVFTLMLISVAMILLMSIIPTALYNIKLTKINSYLVQCSYLCNSAVEAVGAQVEDELFTTLVKLNTLKDWGDNVKLLSQKNFLTEVDAEVEFNKAFMKDFTKSIDTKAFKAELNTKLREIKDNLSTFNTYSDTNLNLRRLEIIDSKYEAEQDYCIIRIEVISKINGYEKSMQSNVFIDMPKFDLKDLDVKNNHFCVDFDTISFNKVTINEVKILLPKELTY